MNEREIIELFHGQSRVKRSGLLCGIGDDCAVIAKDSGCSWLVTIDTLVEGVHFDLRWHPPGKLGRKALSVNVSDIGAMGGEPVFVFLSLGLPRGFEQSWLNRFSEGLAGACTEYGCILAGGDTVQSRQGIVITITVIGEAPADQVVYRSGAMEGDRIWVSGELGRAAAGLELCRQGVAATDATQGLIDAHLDPRPRFRLGMELAQSGIIRSMMDLSDGLATDLSHLCRQSGVGALINSVLLPASPALHEACRLMQLDPLDLMLKGGEDYELLFTAGADADSLILAAAARTGVSVTQVGSIVGGAGVRLVLPGSGPGEEKMVDVTFAGYDHFPDKES